MLKCYICGRKVEVRIVFPGESPVMVCVDHDEVFRCDIPSVDVSNFEIKVLDRIDYVCKKYKAFYDKKRRSKNRNLIRQKRRNIYAVCRNRSRS